MTTLLMFDKYKNARLNRSTKKEKSKNPFLKIDI